MPIFLLSYSYFLGLKPRTSRSHSTAFYHKLVNSSPNLSLLGIYKSLPMNARTKCHIYRSWIQGPILTNMSLGWKQKVGVRLKVIFQKIIIIPFINMLLRVAKNAKLVLKEISFLLASFHDNISGNVFALLYICIYDFFYYLNLWMKIWVRCFPHTQMPLNQITVLYLMLPPAACWEVLSQIFLPNIVLIELGLPDWTNKNMGYQLDLKFHINDE